MAGPKIANTTSANGPDDKLIVVDVYEENGSKVANSYQETHPEAIDVLDGLDGGGEEGLKDQGDIPVNDDFDGLDSDSPNNDLSDIAPSYDFNEVSQDELDEWLAGENYDFLGDINDLGGLKDSFKSMIGGLDQIYVDINGAVSKLNGAVSPRSLNALTSLINKAGCGTYNPNISYRGSSTSFLSGLINAASRLGLPGALNAILNCITDPNVIGGVLSNVLPRVASQANIPLLNDIGNSRIANDVIGIMPNVISQTVSNLGRPNGMQQSQYGGYYGQASQSFNNIDPSWNSTVRYENGSSIDATVVNSNSFFRDTLQANVLSTPATVVINNTSSGNAATVQYGQSPYAPQKYDSESIDAYNTRVATDRTTNAVMSVATGLVAQSVSDSLRKSFGNVGAKLNRSISSF